LGILIGVLATVVLGLGIALAVVVSDDDADETRTVTRDVTRESTVTRTTTTGTDGSTRRADVRRLSSFQSPSKNIGCQLGGGVARCDIREREWSPPPKPANCDVDWGQGISVSRSGVATFVCAGDTAHDASSTMLAYGENAAFGAFTCKSRSNGVTCESRSSGHGFLINRERYRLF
jgi:hypothetical protein